MKLMEIGCREQTVVIFMKEPKQTPTRNLVMECLLGAGSRGMIAREIAACVGGITKGTAGIHARRLENQGLVFSKLESHPGYKHIIRRRYWAKEMST